MNKFIDLIWCFGFLALVWWVLSPMMEKDRLERLACKEKGGAYVSVPHSENYCAVKL